MSEIKTIKGKVEFCVIPITNGMIGYLPLRYDKISLLSEITESRAALLVNLTWNSNEEIKYKTAKESLFSLLKANDCQTKQMVRDGYYYHAHVLDEAGHMKQQDVILRWEENKENLKKKVFAKPIDEFPDDYLLIIKQ